MIAGKQLVQALDNAESIVVITDTHSVISFVNKTFERVYGYTRHEAIGKTPALIKSGYHPQSFYDEMWKSLSGGVSWRGDFINRAKNGTLIIERASISPIFSDDGKTTVGFIAVKEDISVEKKLREQLQLREQLFQKLFENSPIGILILNPINRDNVLIDYEVSESNARICEILNQPSLNESSLKQAFGNNQLVDQLLEGKMRGREVLEWAHHPSGKFLRLRLFNLSSKQECLLVSDVSIQKEMEIRLKESEAHLRKLNDTKDKFFSIIAHDLKNPFQAILGFASLLHQNLDLFSSEEMQMQRAAEATASTGALAGKLSSAPPKADYFIEMKEMVQQIINASEHTYKLLEDLLTWSKSQLGQLKSQPGACQARDLVQKVFQQMDALAFKKDIELKNEIPETLHCLADKDMMEFVMRNLIHNGIKFTPKGGSVLCRASAANGNVMIRVEDTGIGIKPAKLKSLFSLNETLSTPGTSEEAGTGLGLVLVHEMVELNKGRIEVESVPGKGSCFTIFLPATSN